MTAVPDPHTHDGQDYRYEFRWRKPKATVYTAATPRRFAIMLNRYPGIVIGIAVQVRSCVLSVVWARPGRIIRLEGR